jgi:ATP-binding cassette subfamily B protein RaxB
MSFIDQISFGYRRKLPIILQTETTECALACLGMVAGFHGHNIDLASLRRQYQVSLKGSTLANVIQIASQMHLVTRALKLELTDISQLKVPCILHWNLNHFVVLKEVGPKGITIHDPALGIRIVSNDAFSKSFTGIALELWPNQEFEIAEKKQSIRFRDLTGNIVGLKQSFAQIVSLALCLEVFSLVSPLFLQLVIDHVIVSADRSLLTTLAIGFGLLMLMNQIIVAARSWMMLYLGTTLNIQWRSNLFDHLIRLPGNYFEKRHLGDVVSRFGSIDQIQRTLTTSFMEAILDGFMTVITLAMMFIYSPQLSLIALIAMSAYGLIRWFWYAPLRRSVEEQIVQSAKQQSHFIETIRGVKAIKLFQRQNQRRSTWMSLLVSQVNADVRTQKMQLLYRTSNGILFGVESIAIIWVGAMAILNGDFTVGVLMAFNSYKGQFEGRVSSLIDKYFEFRMLQIQGERLSDIVMTEPENVEGHLVEKADRFAAPTIEISRLHYRFSEQEPFVLDGVNLKIGPGESVAIAGPSGCGKTTLINVLLGVLKPTRGEILIDGMNVNHLGLNGLRGIVGTVMQDDVLFAGSISENISFFDPHADQNWIEECAEMAAISEEIASMPMGYGTLVGDMGTALSGGQKQRVLLARALYKKPKILFLDEATSHLDLAREKQVSDAIRSLNITRIIIAHRPETIATADRIVVLSNGKIINETSSRNFLSIPPSASLKGDITDPLMRHSAA